MDSKNLLLCQVNEIESLGLSSEHWFFWSFFRIIGYLVFFGYCDALGFSAFAFRMLGYLVFFGFWKSDLHRSGFSLGFWVI
jgi:hypothetical protein